MVGFGLAGRGAQPGGETEQRQARVAQEAATPEPDLGQLLLAETRLYIHQTPEVFGHPGLPPLDRLFFCDLHETTRIRRSGPGADELDQVGGALVQVSLPGDPAAFELEDERRTLSSRASASLVASGSTTARMPEGSSDASSPPRSSSPGTRATIVCSKLRSPMSATSSRQGVQPAEMSRR